MKRICTRVLVVFSPFCSNKFLLADVLRLFGRFFVGLLFVCLFFVGFLFCFGVGFFFFFLVFAEFSKPF